MVLSFVFIAFLLFGCTQVERDNPYDPEGINYNPDLAETSSSSVEPPPSSSSSETPNSSSDDVPSSSSIEPSSSSDLPSSSSVAFSSSSVMSSSSSSIAPSSNSYVDCTGFDPEAQVEHYGQMKKQFCDERDGKRYVYVTIGTGGTAQTWMAENLNFDATGSKCYNNLASNCEIYGRLYNWDTAMNNSASSTTVPSGVRGVCPDGWHLPSQAEWDVMTAHIGGTSTDAKKLKATNGWNDRNDGTSGNGTDDYGFSALPGGDGSSNGFFGIAGDIGNWWSTSESERDDYDDLVYFRYMNYHRDGTGWGNGSKSILYSVRCLQD